MSRRCHFRWLFYFLWKFYYATAKNVRKWRQRREKLSHTPPHHHTQDCFCFDKMSCKPLFAICLRHMTTCGCTLNFRHTNTFSLSFRLILTCTHYIYSLSLKGSVCKKGTRLEDFLRVYLLLHPLIHFLSTRKKHDFFAFEESWALI